MENTGTKKNKDERWKAVIEPLMAVIIGALASLLSALRQDTVLPPFFVVSILAGFSVVLALSTALVRRILKQRKEGARRLKRELRAAYLGALDHSFLNPKRG